MEKKIDNSFSFFENILRKTSETVRPNRNKEIYHLKEGCYVKKAEPKSFDRVGIFINHLITLNNEKEKNQFQEL